LLTSNSDYLNGETQSLDAELIDSNRFFLNSEDVDIWSTSDETTGDDQQTSPPKRNNFIGYRLPYSDTQSIRSTESHTSQQEIMPAEVRKRLSEVKATGPISFDVR
jgi:hypothetical protein